MNGKNRIVLWLALALVVVLAAGGVAYHVLSMRVTPQTEQTQQDDAEAAPNVTVYDRASQQTQLSDFAGEPVILNFWATWCPPCQAELPEFEQAYQEYGDRIHFMMIDLSYDGRDTQEKAEAFLAENGYTFPLYFDADGTAAASYGAYSIPMTVAVRADGTVAEMRIGALLHGAVQELCESLLEP